MKTLSRHNPAISSLFPAIITLFAIGILRLSWQEQISLKPMVTLVVLLGGGFWTYNRYTHTYQLSYDDAYLFLKNQKEERKLKLDLIRSLKKKSGQLRIFGMPFYEYQLEFGNEAEETESVYFWTFGENSRIREFRNTLKRSSPSTTIKNIYVG